MSVLWIRLYNLQLICIYSAEYDPMIAAIITFTILTFDHDTNDKQSIIEISQESL